MQRQTRRPWTFLVAFGLLWGSPSGPAAAATQVGSVTFLGVSPRIFTPNGDNVNDEAVFHFENPEQAPITGEVFDLSGGQVANLAPGKGNDAFATLVWDGRESGGSTVPAGIYVYQIEFNGKAITGTVVVAR